MPSAFTHAAVGLGLARVLAPRSMPGLYYLVSAILAMLPDLDVIAFKFGIPYGAVFGHRGLAHSLFCALGVGVMTAVPLAAHVGQPWWQLGACFVAITASHGLLDALTNGGMGIALLAPFDNRRYFFGWQPIQVAPIGLGFFSAWGLRALASELVWVWIPLVVLVGGSERVRRLAA